MKKIYILVLLMSFSGFLMAQDAFVPAKKLHSMSSFIPTKTPTDTLAPIGITNNSGFNIYSYLAGGVNVGYVFGTNSKTKAQAQTFALTQSYFIEEVLIWAGYKYINGTAGDLIVSVNRCDGPGTTSTATVNTAPGSQVASTTVSSTDIETTGYYTTAYFVPPVYINSNYAIELDYTTYGDDSLAIVSCMAGDPGNVETSWIKLNANTWRTIMKNFTANIDMYLLVVTDQSTAGIDSPEFCGGMKFSTYPNPAVNNTNIVYELEKSTNVKMQIIDIHGKTIMNIDEPNQASGKHTVNFNTENLSSGNYYISLQANGQKLTKKLVITK